MTQQTGTQQSPAQAHGSRRTSPLRVGIFTESFHPVRNGVATSVLTLIDGLQRRGHNAWVFAPAHQGQRDPEPNVMRFPSFVSVLNPEYPLAYPFIPAITLAVQVNSLALSLVHTQTPFVLGLTGANLAVRSGLPLISTFHTLYSQYTHYMPLLPEPLTQGLLEIYLPWYYRRCDEILCPSSAARAVLEKMGIERPISVIPTGIPLPDPKMLTPEAREAARMRWSIPAGRPLLLYAGRLAPEKEVAWLLEVMAIVLLSAPDAILAIVGAGADEERLREAAQALPPGAVQFLGPLERRDMDVVYSAANIFVMPSPSETQGLVVGEARAAGVPAVVVDSGGAPETVTDGVDGFRVQRGDAAGFAARIVRLILEPGLLPEMSENALRNAALFAPERTLNQMLDVYDRALGRPPRTEETRPIEWQDLEDPMRAELAASAARQR